MRATLKMHVAKPRKSRRLSACGNDKICSDINELVGGCADSLARTGLAVRQRITGYFRNFHVLNLLGTPSFPSKSAEFVSFAPKIIREFLRA